MVLSNTAKRFFVFLIALVCCCQANIHAQTFKFKESDFNDARTALQIRNHGFPYVIDVKHLLLDDIIGQGSQWNSRLKFKALNSYVRLYVDHGYPVKIQQGYKLKLAYELRGYANPMDTTAYTSSIDTLSISYAPDSLAAYQDISIKRYAGYHRIKIILLDLMEITGANASPVSVPMGPTSTYSKLNFIVEGAFQVQPYYKKVRNAANTSYVEAYGSGAEALQMWTGAEQNNLLPVKWNLTGSSQSANLVVTPANYELEWLYVDNYKVDTGVSEKTLAELDYDFRFNSTRVTTDSNGYNIPLVYQKGYLVYRVRMVRPDSAQYRFPIYSNWTLGTSGSLSGLTAGRNYYKINQAHTNDSVNWQYTVSFAEQGKHKHVLSYYDGMLKNRQSITRFNSMPGKLIATEQVYDYEGRPSISILPTPVTTGAFRYQYGLSINSQTGKPYRARDFDSLITGVCPDAETLIPALGNAALANLYYSPNNPDTAGFQKFVPDAEGYPLVQTIYSPGFEDRVDKQGGAGFPLQIGNSHTTRNFYVSGDQADLNRMFGLNIGLSGFYRKTVSKDPNGQLSLNYTDIKGKTVASSLFGIPDTANLALIQNVGAPDTSSFSEDHIAGMQQQIVGNKKILDKAYYNDVDGNNSFTYKTEFTPFPTFCTDKFLTVEAKYFYTVSDLCGDTVLYDGKTLMQTGVRNSGAPIPSDTTINKFLAAGPHYIHKELSYRPDDVVIAVDSYMNMEDNCLKTEAEFIKEEVLERSFPCATCKTLCDIKKDNMMRELWPNLDSAYVERKYGFYTGLSGLGFSNNNSIFTLINGTTGQIISPENWELFALDTTNYYRYQDPCVTLPDTVIRFGQVYTNLRELPVETFIAIFNDEIAEALLPLHPDYCNLLKCIDDTFMTMVKGIPDAQTAEELGLMTLQSLIDRDPVAQNMSALGLSPYDSLAFIYSTNYSLDSIAFAQAYCQCGDAALYTTCLETIFSSQIQQQVLNSEYTRNQYFEKLKTLYFSNRQHLVRFLLPANPTIDCSRCEPIRMTSGGGSNFVNVIDYSNPYTGGNFGPTPANPNGPYPFMISQQFYELVTLPSYDTTGFVTDSLQLEAFGNAMQSLADPAAAESFADSVYNANITLLNNAAVDYIIEKLVNCADSLTLEKVKEYLLQQIADGEVVMGNFKPEQVKAAILYAGINLTDLCHPYLVSYNEVSANNTSRFGCSAPSLYSDIQEFLNKNEVKQSLMSIGSSSNYYLNTNNPVEQEIYNNFGSANINISAEHNSSLGVYILSLYTNAPNDANAIKFYFRTNDITPGCDQPFNVSNTSDLSIEVDCINRAPFVSDGGVLADGYIGAFTFYAKVTKTDGSGTTVCNLAAWNSKILTNTTNTSNIAGCVPCTEMETLHANFMQEMDQYNLKHVDHPYYNTSLRNYVNYALKKSYGYEDYLTFIESCALADRVLLPKQTAYASIFFSNQASAATFINEIRNDIDPTINILPLMQYREGQNSGNYGVVIDFKQLPLNKWRLYKEYIDSYGPPGVIIKFLNAAYLDIVGSNLLARVVTTQQLSPTQLSLATDASGFTLTANNAISWFNGQAYQTAYAIEFSGSGIHSDDISRGLHQLQQYFYENNIGATIFDHYQSTINDQYDDGNKKNYLSHVYQFSGQHPSYVLDQISVTSLGQNLFTGYNMSYGNLNHPENLQNLYFMKYDSDTFGTQFYMLEHILNGAAGYFGNQQIFSTQQRTHIQSNNKFILYKNSDNSYWYRYFDANNKLYNVFLYKPKYISIHQLQGYQLDKIILTPGDTAVNAFKLRMRKPGGSPETITLTGYTDFNIGNSRNLHDVLLKDPAYNPVTEYAYNCERFKLEAAIYEGKVRYIQYRDSIRNLLINDFNAYVLQGFVESLKSSYKTQRFNYTVYEYDRANNLIRTIPPAGVEFLTAPYLDGVNAARQDSSTSAQFLPKHRKASVYEYNSLNQVVKQSTPDGGRTEFFYDNAGRAIFSQNELQRLSGKMTYTLYDKQSRIIETGQAKIACAPYFTPFAAPMPANFTCGYTVSGMVTPFPPQVQNLTSYNNEQVIAFVRALTREDVVLTHYDESAVALSGGMSPQENLRKRVSSIKFFSALQAANTTFANYDYAMHFSYDIAGNVKTLTRDYPAWAPAGQRFKRVDYDYDLISGKVNLLSYNRGYADQFYQKYDYDADNRIIEVKTSSDGTIWNRDAAYQYYQHGPLARMSLGQERVQGVDYAYTIQGWLKAINGDILAPGADMGKDNLGNSAHARDAVALSIDYFNGDYKPIGTTQVTQTPAGLKNLYNGNIPATSTDIKPFEHLSTAYTYDQLNRLVRANYSELLQDTQYNATQKYYNSYAYDADGNIQKLVRNGNNTSLLAMDSIVYRYTVGNNDNRLQNVNDYVADNYSNDIKQNTINNVSRYLYDPTGNLVKDLVSGQDTIQWNHYNKVTQVVQNGADSMVLRFDYDGSGQRYMKTNVRANQDTTIENGEYYVRDAQGNILAVYKAESRYEMSPVTVWEYVVQPAIMQVGPTQFINAFLAPAYANNGGFQNYMVDQGINYGLQETAIYDHPASYFLSGNHALYSGFLSSADYGAILFKDLKDFSVASGGEKVPLAVALHRESDKNPEYHHSFIHTLYGSGDMAEQRVQAIRAIWTGDEHAAPEVFARIGMDYNPDDENVNLDQMMAYLSDDPESVNKLSDALYEVVTRSGTAGADYYKALAQDDYLQETALTNNTELLNAQQYAMISQAYDVDFGEFADNWEHSVAVLNSTASAKSLLQALYAANTTEYVNAVYAASGSNNNLLFGSVSAAYHGSFSLNISHLVNVLDHYLTYQVPVTTWQNLLKYQNLNLASHHLYGSSRLGTRDYLSGQLYSRIDLTGSSPIMDTMMLTARRPWYSSEYNELIGGGSTTPWGMADQGTFQLVSQIGQKQYELSNHLGNVQATVSDLPYRRQYIPPGIDTVILSTEPALVSAYDYYPFGMLMPGRYVSDTTERCMTITRSGWTTIMVDSCTPLIATATSLYTIGSATAVYNGSHLAFSAAREVDGAGFMAQVAAGVDNSFEFNVSKLDSRSDQGVLVTVLETIDNVQYVIGGGRLQFGPKQRINFRSTGNNVSLLFTGPFNMVELAQVCTKYPKSVQHTYLVDVCDEDKDRYRFGYNGQEKDNELKGIGNSINYEARMQDTRLGRFLSLDPLSSKFPFYSPYQFAGNTPIQAIDLDGNEPFYNSQRGYSIKWYYQNFNPNVSIRSKIEDGLTLGKQKFGYDAVVRLKVFSTENNALYREHNRGNPNYPRSVYSISKKEGYYDCVTAQEAGLQIIKNDYNIKLPPEGQADLAGQKWQKEGIVGSAIEFRAKLNKRVGEKVTQKDFDLGNVAFSLLAKSKTKSGTGTTFFTVEYGKDFHGAIASVSERADGSVTYALYDQMKGAQIFNSAKEFDQYLSRFLYLNSTNKQEDGDRTYNPGNGNISQGNEKVVFREVQK